MILRPSMIGGSGGSSSANHGSIFKAASICNPFTKPVDVSVDLDGADASGAPEAAKVGRSSFLMPSRLNHVTSSAVSTSSASTPPESAAPAPDDAGGSSRAPHADPPPSIIGSMASVGGAGHFFGGGAAAAGTGGAGGFVFGQKLHERVAVIIFYFS